MSSLLDRYVHAVQRYLPADQSADIGAELKETVQSRFDDEAATKGRPLTSDEESVILRSVGRPVLVASRYGTVGYLIGPALYPYFCATLRALASIGVPFAAVAVVVTAMTADAPLAASFGVLAKAANATWAVLGIVTLIFWQMGRATTSPNFDDDWDPAELPEVPRAERTVPRAVSLGHAVCLAIYLLWWTGVLPLSRWLGVRPLEPDAMLAPVWQTLFLVIAVLLSAHLVLHLTSAWRRQVSKAWRVAHVACDVVTLGILYVLINADALVVMTTAGPMSESVQRLNDLARVGLIGLSALVVLGVIDEGRHLFGAVPVPDGSWKTALAANGRALRMARHMRDLGGRPGGRGSA